MELPGGIRVRVKIKGKGRGKVKGRGMGEGNGKGEGKGKGFILSFWGVQKCDCLVQAKTQDKTIITAVLVKFGGCDWAR